MFNTNEFLKQAYAKGAADIHLRIGKPPSLRILNDIVRVNLPALSEADFDSILRAICQNDNYERVKSSLNADFAYEIEGIVRFRVNFCHDLGVPKLTMRTIPYEVPSLEEMAIPASFKHFARNNNGIILITGPTGSGKSTTIACMLDYINRDFSRHIVTVEDPVEFVYKDKKSLITQKQLGVDVANFADGVKYALRQDPDIILIGEIRDRETVETALAAAETGHLVLSTIHTNSAIQTINRIINMFDEHLKNFVRERLAISLRGTIAQKLIPKKTGGRVPAFEVMTVTSTISDYIKKNELEKIYPLIQEGGFDNMMTLNSSIYNLLNNGIVEEEHAYRASENPIELQQMIRGYYHGVKHRSKNDDIVLD
ncbi:MAG: PilT/PilU family type 4a pilus ATPase [Cyanobacteria bacterium SIG30]|nr:PilT/PilU family type 4a pilus ATPase [Cyanobacteria bacterium SIG30]